MPAWLIFVVSAAAVALAGSRLARDGDTIAEGTGLGGMWVGAILVAGATSLPELLTDASAIRLGYPELAVGDLFGSSMANMMILAVADLVTRSTRMLTRVAVNQALVGTLAIALTIVAALGVLVRESSSVLGIGGSALVVGFTYVVGTRVLHRNRQEPPFRTTADIAARPGHGAQRRAVIGFTLSALVILVAAPFVARSAADLALELGISRGFAGVLLLALTTSLPEASVTVACVRRGWYGLAVGNLLGSNCFNMAALVPLDLIQGSGSLLGVVDSSLALSALFAILLMALALLDILNKSERRIWIIEPGPAFMVLAYVIGLVVTYRVAH